MNRAVPVVGYEASFVRGRRASLWEINQATGNLTGMYANEF